MNYTSVTSALSTAQSKLTSSPRRTIWNVSSMASSVSLSSTCLG